MGKATFLKNHTLGNVALLIAIGASQIKADNGRNISPHLWNVWKTNNEATEPQIESRILAECDLVDGCAAIVAGKDVLFVVSIDGAEFTHTVACRI